jgi:hypothetical protein
MLDRGVNRAVLFTSCDGLVKNETLMEDMHQILSLLQETYDYPVDIEYTINVSPEGRYYIDLLQCRPLQMAAEGGSVSVPAPGPGEQVLLETKGVSMGFSRQFSVDVLVYVDAIAYYNMPYVDKYKVKSALSAINWRLREQSRRMVLITPGRICTSSPELGVPSAFADISEFDTIIEVSEKRAGYMPELSYGSHIFQDLVEAGILYTAVFEGNHTIAFHPEILESDPGMIRDITEEITKPAEEQEGILRVFDCSASDLTLYYDLTEERLLITL